MSIEELEVGRRQPPAYLHYKQEYVKTNFVRALNFIEQVLVLPKSGSTKKENPGLNHCERVQKGPVRVRTIEPLFLISKNYKKILDYTTS